MDKFCKSKSYHEGIQKDALISLNDASNAYRDTLRVTDLHEGDSVVGADSDDDASRASVIADDHGRPDLFSDHGRPDLFSEDGCPDGAMVPEPWEVHDSTSRPGEYVYRNTVTNKSTRTHPALKSRSSIKEPPNLFHADGSPDVAQIPAS